MLPAFHSARHCLIWGSGLEITGSSGSPTHHTAKTHHHTARSCMPNTDLRSFANYIFYRHRRNLGRQANPTRPNAPPSRGNTSSPSAYSPSSQGPLPSPSQSSSTMAQNDQAHQSNQTPHASQSSKKNVPYFFREQCAGFVVKGNFMTLAAKPQLVEEGEWLAHQSGLHTSVR